VIVGRKFYLMTAIDDGHGLPDGGQMLRIDIPDGSTDIKAVHRDPGNLRIEFSYAKPVLAQGTIPKTQLENTSSNTTFLERVTLKNVSTSDVLYTIQYGHDGFGNLTQATRTAGVSLGTNDPKQQWSYKYDPAPATTDEHFEELTNELNHAELQWVLA